MGENLLLSWNKGGILHNREFLNCILKTDVDTPTVVIEQNYEGKNGLLKPSADPEPCYVFINESWALYCEYVGGILASLVNVVLRRLLQAEAAGASDR
jgi:hypothetical protein